MIYVPIIYSKQAEMKLGKKAQDRLSDPRVKPYIRLMASAHCESPNKLLETLGLEKSCPFIGIPRITKTETIKAAKSQLIRDANSSEQTYFDAEINLINADAIIVYDCTAPKSEYEAFVEKCHEANKPIALFTDESHPVDFAVLEARDWVLFNIKQNLYATGEIIDKIRSDTSASIVLVLENRSIQTTNKSLEDGEEIDADGNLIFGDLVKEIKKNGYKLEGFGDFCGWKNTVNVRGGAKGNKAIKTITLFNRKEWHFKVIKDSPELPLKSRVQSYMRARDPSDSIGTVHLLNTCISVGGHAEFNALSIYHYIQEMLLNDDWSSI